MIPARDVSSDETSMSGVLVRHRLDSVCLDQSPRPHQESKTSLDFWVWSPCPSEVWSAWTSTHTRSTSLGKLRGWRSTNDRSK